MRGKKPGMAALVAGLGVATAIMGAPLAAADTCDPTATVCQGGDITSGPAPDAAPAVVAPEDQYPFDDSWYFDPAGGGTLLHPENPPAGHGGDGGGGGGGHH
jgi:hypothetical protein